MSTLRSTTEPSPTRALSELFDGSVSARVFAAEDPVTLKVDDFSTSTGLIVKTDTVGNGTFDRTWTSADYQLEPLNGVVEGIEGWPYWRIRAIDDEAFPVDPTGRARVQVTAKWGWAAVPDAVFQACLIQSLANFKRKDAPFGVIGFDEMTGADEMITQEYNASRLTVLLSERGTVAEVRCGGSSRRVTSVTTPRVPSLPTKSLVRLRPATSFSRGPPRRTAVPSASTTCRPST